MKLIAEVIAAADVAVVVYVEKVLVTSHAATRELVVTGLIFALPALIILLVAWLRRGGGPASPAPRTGGYPFRGGQ